MYLLYFSFCTLYFWHFYYSWSLICREYIKASSILFMVDLCPNICYQTSRLIGAQSCSVYLVIFSFPQFQIIDYICKIMYILKIISETEAFVRKIIADGRKILIMFSVKWIEMNNIVRCIIILEENLQFFYYLSSVTAIEYVVTLSWTSTVSLSTV